MQFLEKDIFNFWLDNKSRAFLLKSSLSLAKNQLKSFFIISFTPFLSKAMTGTHNSIASKTEIPKESIKEGNKNKFDFCK